MSQGNIAGTMTKMRIYNKTVKRKIYCLFCLVMGKPHFLLCEKTVILFVPSGGMERILFTRFGLFKGIQAAQTGRFCHHRNISRFYRHSDWFAGPGNVFYMLSAIPWHDKRHVKLKIKKERSFSCNPLFLCTFAYRFFLSGEKWTNYISV